MPLVVKKIEVEWVVFHDDKIIAHLSGERKWEKIVSTLEIINPELQKQFKKRWKGLTKSVPVNGSLKLLVSDRQAINGECFIWCDLNTNNKVVFHELCFTQVMVDFVKEVKGIVVSELSKL